VASPIYIDVSDTCTTSAQTGIQTLVTSLVSGMARAAVPFQLVRWVPHRGGFVPLRRRELARFPSMTNPPDVQVAFTTWLRVRGRVHRVPIHQHKKAQLDGAWLLTPELMYSGDAAAILEYARSHGMRTAAVFHDAIPITHPQISSPKAAADHLDYLRTLCRFDIVLPVSTLSKDEFERIARAEALPLPQLIVCTEAAEIAGVPRATQPAKTSTPKQILCVSTLDPRKNHARLLAAFDLLDSDAELHLVGDVFKAAPEIAEQVTAATARNPRIKWHGKIAHAQIQELYRSCSFTVFPSVLEGFGLPVVESLWFGKPCICANTGPMAESAAGGGCLTTNVEDPQEIARAIQTLLTRPEVLEKLTQQACTRPLQTWRDYAQEITAALARA
jgi:glycosyltransferase involved in cell wall biosynthesis